MGLTVRVAPVGGEVTYAPFEVVRQGGQANNTVLMVVFVVLGAGISVVS